MTETHDTTVTTTMIRALRAEAAAAGDSEQVRLCTAALGEGYLILATRDRGGGLVEGVGSAETLGDAWGRIYATEGDAEEACEELRATWDDAWGLGACPDYTVSRQGGPDASARAECERVILEWRADEVQA